MSVNLNIDAKNTPIPEKKPKFKFNFKLNKWVYISIGIILLLVGAFLTYRALEFSNNVGLKLKTDDFFNPIKKDPELKKDSTGKYTSALMVGIDTRSDKSDLRNTDSMIIATYNHETRNITMISVPRDTYVKVPGENWYTKINAIYGNAEGKKKGSGMNTLKDTLQNMTGVEIQYHALVDLQGFRKMIDAVGGVTVNVENTFTDYLYPTEAKGKPIYETVTFKKGPQKMDGATALKYARSRHSPDNNEGTDFARARRQQKVISALKDKVLSSETLLNPQKILELMNAVQDNVKISEFTNEDIQAGINIAKKLQEEKGKVYSFVLEPSFANYEVFTTNVPGTNAYVIAPSAGLDNYSQVRQLVKLCLTKPSLYSEKNLTIRVYDIGLGNDLAKAKTDQLKKKYPFLNIAYQGTLLTKKQGDYVYNKDKKLGEIVNEFAAFLKTDKTSKPEYITTNLNGESITILLGKPIVTEENK